jgi:hypothetical protein
MHFMTQARFIRHGVRIRISALTKRSPTWAIDVKGKLLGRILCCRVLTSKICVLWATDAGQLRP